MPNISGYPTNLELLPYWGYQPELKGLSGIFLNSAIRNFAFGVLGILIPIYVYQITHSINTTVLFFIIYRIITLATLYPSVKVIEKVGPDFSMLLSSFLAAFYLTSLSLLPDVPQLLWPAAVLGGIQLNLHWLPYHTAFSNVTKEKNLSKNIANASNLSQLAKATAPLIGGIIATHFGLPSLLLASVLLLTISSLPVFFDEYNKKEKVWPLKKLIKNQIKPKNRYLSLTFFFQGFRTAIDGTIWPLILYFVISDFKTIGGITTITLLTSFITFRWIGKNLKHFKIQAFVSGNVARSFIWLVRVIASHPIIVGLTDPIYQLATTFVGIPRTILIYQFGKRQKINFFTQREAALSFGRIVSLGIVFLVLKVGLPWSIVPILPIIGLTLDNLSAYKFNKRKKTLLEEFRIKLTRL